MSSKTEIEYTKTFQHCTQNGMVKYYIYIYDMSYWNRTTLSFACVLGSSVLTHKHQSGAFLKPGAPGFARHQLRLAPQHWLLRSSNRPPARNFRDQKAQPNQPNQPNQPEMKWFEKEGFPISSMVTDMELVAPQSCGRCSDAANIFKDGTTDPLSSAIIGPNWEDHDHSHHFWSLFSEGVSLCYRFFQRLPDLVGQFTGKPWGEDARFPVGFQSVPLPHPLDFDTKPVSAVWIFGFQGTEFQPPIPGPGFTSCPWQGNRLGLQMSRWRRFRAILGCHATSALVTLFTTPNSWCINVV